MKKDTTIIPLESCF